MPLIKFNWVDILFVTLIIRICYVAFKNGFLPEFFRLFGLLAAFIISFNSYTALSAFIAAHAKWTGIKPAVISFSFIFLAILLIFKMLSVGVSMLLGHENVSRPNKLTGLTLGFVRGLLFVSLVYVFFVNSPFGYLSTSAKDRSFSGNFFSRVAPAVYNACVTFYPGGKNETPLVRLLEKV